MTMLSVRNLPDMVHRALRMRAAQNGRSTEAEVRAILTTAVQPAATVRMGDALSALGQEIGLTNEDMDFIDHIRECQSAEPMRFE